MSLESEVSKSHERVPATVSVAALIRPRLTPSRIILVRNGNEGWGLPAGGLKVGENLQEALSREVLEETGIMSYRLKYSGQVVRTDEGELLTDQKPLTLFVPRENKISIGLVYEAMYIGPSLPKEGWGNPTSDKVDRIRTFSPREVGKLIVNTIDEADGERVYKPEFNMQVLVYSLIGMLDKDGSGPEYVNRLLEKLHSINAPGLVKTDTYVRGWYFDSSAGLKSSRWVERIYYGLVSGGRPYSFERPEF